MSDDPLFFHLKPSREFSQPFYDETQLKRSTWNDVWVHIDASFPRMKALLRSRDLVLHDLLSDLRERHMLSAVRNPAGKGGQVGFLTPKFWRDEVASLEEESGHIRILTPTGKALDINVFVRRADVDRRYAEPVVRLVPATAATPDAVRRRKPGPKPTENWQDHVLREIARARHRGEPLPAAADLAQSCGETLGYVPDVSAINKLIKATLR
jgi:hypothetical protein